MLEQPRVPGQHSHMVSELAIVFMQLQHDTIGKVVWIADTLSQSVREGLFSKADELASLEVAKVRIVKSLFGVD